MLLNIVASLSGYCQCIQLVSELANEAKPGGACLGAQDL